MEVFSKQDFSPTILSKRWLQLKVKPNILVDCERHIVSILESALMFREDCATIEQYLPTVQPTQVVKRSWADMLTNGRLIGLCGVGTILLVLPPRMNMSWRGNGYRLLCCILTGVVLDAVYTTLTCKETLTSLVTVMREYTALVRRCMSTIREYQLLNKSLQWLNSIVTSALTLICEQQLELLFTMCRASTAILTNFHWLSDDLSWTALDNISHLVDQHGYTQADLTKIHHTFLVVQSTLLKHIGMAHVQHVYNTQQHNARLHWLHSQLLVHLHTLYEGSARHLQRTVRLIRNYHVSDATARRPGAVLKDDWHYSGVQATLATINMNLRSVLAGTTELELLLDDASNGMHTVDTNKMEADLSAVVLQLTTILSTVNTAQLRLKRLQPTAEKPELIEAVACEETTQPTDIVDVTNTYIEPRDEVYYMEAVGQEQHKPACRDAYTTPGQMERNNTLIVLNELKSKLAIRESLMRERERLALAETMPQLRDNMPQFPRQIPLPERSTGYIHKIQMNQHQKTKPELRRKKLKRKYHRAGGRCAPKHLNKDDMTRLCRPKLQQPLKSAVPHKHSAVPMTVPSSDSSSEAETLELLNDVRRYRAKKASGKRQYKPEQVCDTNNTEHTQYNLGTGLALAAILRSRRVDPVAEQVFVGDGQMSSDSGNEEDT